MFVEMRSTWCFGNAKAILAILEIGFQGLLDLKFSSKFTIYMYLGMARCNTLPVTLMTRCLYGDSGGWFQWSLLPVYKIRWGYMYFV